MPKGSQAPKKSKRSCECFPGAIISCAKHSLCSPKKSSPLTYELSRQKNNVFIKYI